MKRFGYGLLAAVMVAASAAIPAASEAAAPKGQWLKDSKGWWYEFADGSYAKSEFIGGYWINRKGYWDEGIKYKWYQDEEGWWFGDNSKGGWYAKNQTIKIDGLSYYFNKRGYMACEEYIKGQWYGKNGLASTKYNKGTWKRGTGKMANKWWYQDGTWYPVSTWLKIDGVNYYFNEEGYMVSWKVGEYKDGPLGDGIYAFNSQGKLTNATVFNFAADVEGTIEFTFEDGDDEAKNQAAEDMDFFLTETIDPSTVKTVEVDGVEKTLSIKEVDCEGDLVPMVFIDDETLVDYVARTKTFSTVVFGSINMKKFVEAFDASGLGLKGAKYSYRVILNDEVEITALALSKDFMNITIDGTKYSAVYVPNSSKLQLAFLSDLSDDLAPKLESIGLIEDGDTAFDKFDTNGKSYVVVNTGTGVAK